jgi:hypothetical protein
MRALVVVLVLLAGCGVPEERASTERARATAPPPLAEGEFLVPISSDPRARYIVMKRGGTAARPTLITRREGQAAPRFRSVSSTAERAPGATSAMAPPGKRSRRLA